MEQHDAEALPLHSFQIIRNRRGIPIRVVQREHVEASLAIRTSSHNKGAAYLQPVGPEIARIGKVWALTGVLA